MKGRKTMIKEATFESWWDGDTCISTACKVNMETREVFDIEMAQDVECLNTLDAECVVIDASQYPVFREDEAGPADYFYR